MGDQVGKQRAENENSFRTKLAMVKQVNTQKVHIVKI